MAGCHPHQWSPAQSVTFWSAAEGGRFTSARANFEAYITHNGDLDFFTLHGRTYPLEDVQKLLVRLLHAKCAAAAAPATAPAAAPAAAPTASRRPPFAS